ncbi:MAG: hypothetical protein AABY92_03445, partial [Thermodesulfobacteriota bacterium]
MAENNELAKERKKMKGNDRQNQCDACGAATPAYEGVNFSQGETRRFLCSRCFNEAVAKDSGVDFHHLSFHPITLADTIQVSRSLGS